MKKKKHQLDWSSIKILAKENNHWKRRSKEAYFITKHKDKVPLLNKKNVGFSLESLCVGIIGKFIEESNNVNLIVADIYFAYDVSFTKRLQLIVDRDVE